MLFKTPLGQLAPYTSTYINFSAPNFTTTIEPSKTPIQQKKVSASHRHHMKNISLILAIISISGCVGIHTETQQSKVSKATDTYYLNNTKQRWSQSEHPANGSVTLSSERKWCGATLWVIVPIPLMLPLCKNYTKVAFENGEPTLRSEGWVSAGNFYGCGPGVWLGSSISNGQSASFCVAD